MCIRDRSGLIAATFCRNHVADPVHPTRSASTVAGIEGVASSSCLTCCSNGSKLLTTGEREYSGGPTEATAFATVFLEILRSLAICAFDTPSLRCSLRINAQSSKVITFPSWVGAHFSSVTSAQFSTVIDIFRDATLELNAAAGQPCSREGSPCGHRRVEVEIYWDDRVHARSAACARLARQVPTVWSSSECVASSGTSMRRSGGSPWRDQEAMGCLLYTSDAADDLLCV